MIKTYVDSFKENILHKTSNPFFGSLIIVWSIHNWRFLFRIFNFTSTETIDQRATFIASYLDPSSFLPNLAWCIVLSFIVLISSYFLLNLSRLIINFFERTVTPFVYKITDRSSIVLKTEYELLLREKDQLSARFEDERKNRVNLQNELTDLEKKYVNLQNEFDKSNQSNLKSENIPTPTLPKIEPFVPSDLEIEILKILSRNEPNKVPVITLNSALKNTNMTKTQHYLSKLRSFNYVVSDHTGYGLSDNGRSFLVNNAHV